MSDLHTNTNGAIRCSLWGAKGAVEELPTNPLPQPSGNLGRDARVDVPALPVGRLRYYHKWRGHGGTTWNRLRYWPTRRRVLAYPRRIQSENAAAREDHRRQAADLVDVGALMLGARAASSRREAFKTRC